ncbi:MAG TPA: histidinol-phosphate transaminase, partial [Kiloniellaceae bacterium]
MTIAPRPGILEVAPYVGGESKAAGANRVIRLASNENPLGPSPLAVAAYEAEKTQLHRYPDGGAGELRKAIAEAESLDASRIVCGAGSDELIGLLV